VVQSIHFEPLWYASSCVLFTKDIIWDSRTTNNQTETK
jgi:hypothetical protein